MCEYVYIRGHTQTYRQVQNNNQAAFLPLMKISGRKAWITCYSERKEQIYFTGWLSAIKSESESHSVVSDSLWPHGLYSPWNSPGQNTGVSSCSLLQGIFPTQVSCIAGGFFTSWATIAAKNTGVRSLSLLQRIFLTQELNWGLLHCRWILYQLTYKTDI